MAYTTPRTWTAGETVTAALMNTHLRDNLTAIVAANPLVVPAARVSHGADQTISNDTQTTLAFNKEKYDYDAIHDNTTNNSRLTCKTAGLYTITASIQFASNSSGSRAILILLNGKTIIGGDQRDASPDIATTCNVSVDYPLAVNDYVEVQAYQNRGGNLNVVSSGERTPLFMMKYIGKAS